MIDLLNKYVRKSWNIVTWIRLLHNAVNTSENKSIKNTNSTYYALFDACETITLESSPFRLTIKKF